MGSFKDLCEPNCSSFSHLQDAVEKVEYYPVDQVSDDDDDAGDDADDDHNQLYEDPALYTGLECGQITFTSGDTLRGWFSGDLSSVRVGELTRWSQVCWVSV